MTSTTYLTPHQLRQRRAAERRPLDRAAAEADLLDALAAIGCTLEPLEEEKD